jgi:selenocysteine lyase/cysteine desulfurase
VFALGASSNALGTVNDIALARRLTRQVGALLVIDAVHYAPHFSVDVEALGADFLLCSAYKFYGPHVGILYSAPGALDRLPTDRLSTQDPAAPFRIETGTLNHAAIHGVRAAIEYLASWGRGASLRERLIDAFSGISEYEHDWRVIITRRWSGYAEFVFGGPGSRRVCARRPFRSHSRTAVPRGRHRLGEHGICVWDGNFYAARAVEVLGVAERGGLLRTGISMYSSREEIERLLEGLGEIAANRVNIAMRG